MARQVQWALSRIFAIVASVFAVILPTQARSTPSTDRSSGEEVKAFVLSLMNDPAKLIAFRHDPDAVLAETNLSPDEKFMLKIGDYEKIRELVVTQARPLPPIQIRPTPNPDRGPKPTDPPPKPPPKPEPPKPSPTKPDPR